LRRHAGTRARWSSGAQRVSGRRTRGGGALLALRVVVDEMTTRASAAVECCVCRSGCRRWPAVEAGDVQLLDRGQGECAGPSTMARFSARPTMPPRPRITSAPSSVPRADASGRWRAARAYGIPGCRACRPAAGGCQRAFCRLSLQRGNAGRRLTVHRRDGVTAGRSDAAPARPGALDGCRSGGNGVAGVSGRRGDLQVVVIHVPTASH
jgi:hypothetical protein